MPYLTVPLHASHRKEFCCGVELLDRYLHKQAKQDVKRKLAVCFVLPEKDIIKGYYTLSNAGIPREIVPEKIRMTLPQSYRNLPTTLMGRLAVDKKYLGKGIGELLLIDALKRSYNISITSIASMAVIVDPFDKNAAGFYRKYGFIHLPDSGKMFLPMKTISTLFKN